MDDEITQIRELFLSGAFVYNVPLSTLQAIIVTAHAAGVQGMRTAALRGFAEFNAVNDKTRGETRKPATETLVYPMRMEVHDFLRDRKPISDWDEPMLMAWLNRELDASGASLLLPTSHPDWARGEAKSSYVIVERDGEDYIFMYEGDSRSKQSKSRTQVHQDAAKQALKWFKKYRVDASLAWDRMLSLAQK